MGYRLFCISQCKHADSDIRLSLQHRPDTRFQRGTCGQHIIDEKDMLTIIYLRIVQTETVKCVFIPLKLVLMGLGGSIYNPFQIFGNGNFRHRSNSLSNSMALIITAMPDFFLMKRNRHQIIHTTEEIATTMCCHGTKIIADFGTLPVF